MKVYYNIHNLVRIKVDTKNQSMIMDYDYRFRNFRIAAVEESMVDLEIRDMECFSLPEKALVISDNFFGFKHGIYNKKEHYAVILDDKKMTVFVENSNISLLFLVEFFLLKQGCTFVHSAAISYKGKGIIFPAPQNTGKTLLISKLREKENVKFFGDDYVIVQEKGKMYSYPMDFSIYNHHLSFFKELNSPIEKIKMKRAIYERIIVKLVKNSPIKYIFKKIARFLHYDFMQGGEYIKVPTDRLIPQSKMGVAADLKYSIFLSRYNGDKFKAEKMDLEILSRGIQGILQTEWMQTKPIFFLLSSFFLLDLAGYLNDMKKTIYKSFEGAELYRIFIPKKMDNEEYLKEMEKFLEENIFNRIK